MSENIKGSLRVLLSEIVDYAGLFPPAKLSMAAAVQNYANYIKGEHAWMLGRFIVPIDSLDNFAAQARSFWVESQPWRISLLANENLRDAGGVIEKFNALNAGKAVIDALETRAESAAQVKEAKIILAPDINTYFEIPLTSNLPEQISALTIARLRAKIRTGGTVQDAFPPVDEIIKFLRVCLAANLPFKATAGLHHPLRTVKPLSYEPGAPTGTMHGFLNLFLAAAFLRQNLNNTFVHRLMMDGDIANFQFTDEAVIWNGSRLEINQLKLTRERSAISFGSCSFVEPIEDLQQLGLL